MIADDLIDKAALAGLNAVRTAKGFPSLASIEELPPDVTYHWRQEYRAALEAVEADIRNAALEEACVVRLQADLSANAEAFGACEQCGAPLFEADDYVSDPDGVSGCWHAMTDIDPKRNRPCFSYRVGKPCASLKTGEPS